MTNEQQRMEAAAGSASAKLRTFVHDLTPDEREFIALALRQVASGAGGPADDAAGHALRGQPPLIGVAVVQQLAVAEVVRTMLSVFGIEPAPQRL